MNDAPVRAVEHVQAVRTGLAVPASTDGASQISVHIGQFALGAHLLREKVGLDKIHEVRVCAYVPMNTQQVHMQTLLHVVRYHDGFAHVIKLAVRLIQSSDAYRPTAFIQVIDPLLRVLSLLFTRLLKKPRKAIERHADALAPCARGQVELRSRELLCNVCIHQLLHILPKVHLARENVLLVHCALCSMFTLHKGAEMAHGKGRTSKKYYAVARGRAPGVYSTWAQCRAQVEGYRGALFKSFAEEEEAWTYVGSADLVLQRDARVYCGAPPTGATGVVHVSARSAAYPQGGEEAYGTYTLHVLQGTPLHTTDRVQSGRLPRATSNQAAVYAWTAAFDFMTQYAARSGAVVVVFSLTHASQYVLDVFARDILHSTCDWMPSERMKNRDEWRLLHAMYHRFLEDCAHVVYVQRAGTESVERELAQQRNVPMQDAQ